MSAIFDHRMVGWAVLLGAAGVGLCLVPLFDVLGYDYAFAIGLFAAFAGVDIGHGTGSGAGRAFTLDTVRVATTRALGALIPPLAVSLLNATRVKNCSIPSGLAFYALLPVATVLFAAPLGTISGSLFPRAGGRWLAFSLPAVSFIWTLGRLYWEPPVFAFDPFGGYFPGPIYDEAMRPPARLCAYRAANMVWVAAAIATYWAINMYRNGAVCWRRAAALASILVAASAALFLARGALGFHTGKDRLQKILARETRSRHFVLHTDPNAGDTSTDLDLAQRDLEFRYAQLAHTLGVEPGGIIDVYQFPSAAAKKAAVGAGATLYAKPWTREVFLQTERFPANRLRHELAHVFAGTFGDPVFGVALAWRFAGPLPIFRLASGLVEGLAEAAAFTDPDGRATLHEEAQAMIADGRAPPLAQVVGAGFSTLSGVKAYTLAGSFCRFLLDRHGPERLRALYHSAGDFPGVYGQPLGVLETQWRAFLATQPIDATLRADARERFRRPAIFQKVCARELAARVQEARNLMNTQPGEAVALLASVCHDDPHEPTFQLEWAHALFQVGKFDQAAAIAKNLSEDPSTTDPVRAHALSLAATMDYRAGRFDAAAQKTQEVSALATDEGDRRTATVKLRALQDSGARSTLGPLLFGDGQPATADPGAALALVSAFSRRFPAEALGPYLVARQLAYRDPPSAIPRFEEACPLSGGALRPLPLENMFLRECWRLYGETAFRTEDLVRAKAAFLRLLDAATSEAGRLHAADFLERIDWEQRH